MRKIRSRLPVKSLAPLLLLAVIGISSRGASLDLMDEGMKNLSSLLSNSTNSLLSALSSSNSALSKFFDGYGKDQSDQIHLTQSGIEHKALRRKGFDYRGDKNSYHRNDTDQVLRKEADGKVQSLNLAYYYHSLSVLKKNYRDTGVRAALRHQPQKSSQEPALQLEVSAWGSQDIINKLIKTECGLSDDCKKKFNSVSFDQLQNFPFPTHELKGLKPVFDKETKQFVCPEFKNAELTHLNPLIQLTAMDQVFSDETLKTPFPKIWIPLNILDQPPHLEKNTYLWTELGLDNSQKNYFSTDLRNEKETICLPYEANGEFIGDVGGSCSEDNDCLSGCCQNGACAPHNPSKNIFCNKEVKKSCLTSEHCQYQEEASVWGGVYRNDKCNITNSFKGREHNACIKNKCVSDSGGLISIKYKRKLSEKECQGLNIPAPDEVTVYQLDEERKFIMKDHIPLTETKAFEK